MKKVLTIIAAITTIIGILLYAQAFGQSFVEIDTVDDGAGYYYGVWGDGTYIYAARSGDGLSAYTFNGTVYSAVIDTIDNGGNAWDVWGDGTYIYLANRADGLRAYTFNGTTFTNVGHIDNFGNYFGVTGDGTYIYVAHQQIGFSAYSFNGTNFTLLDTVDPGGDAEEVFYESSTSTIHCADSNTGLFAYTFNGAVFVAVDDIDPGVIDSVYGNETHIFATGGDTLYAYEYAGVAYNLLDSVTFGGNVGTAAGTDGVYVYWGRDLAGWRAYSWSGAALGFLDAQDTSLASDIWFDGTYLHLADGPSGLRAWFFASLTSSQVIGINID